MMSDYKNEQLSGISLVLPCLNEEQSLASVVANAEAGLKKTSFSYEILVVDNGSNDRSRDIAKELDVRLIDEPHKGYGSALRRGFAEAKYDVIVMGDADLTYDFSMLDSFLEPILGGNAEFVVGNRMKHIQPGAMPTLHRYLGNPLLTFFLRVMFHHYDIQDAHCGMRAILAHTYRRLQCVTTGMEFASEMIVRAIHLKVPIEQIDIEYHPRLGESKLRSFRDGWRHLRFMLLHSPTFVLMLPGFFFGCLGFFFRCRWRLALSCSRGDFSTFISCLSAAF